MLLHGTKRVSALHLQPQPVPLVAHPQRRPSSSSSPSRFVRIQSAELDICELSLFLRDQEAISFLPRSKSEETERTFIPRWNTSSLLSPISSRTVSLIPWSETSKKSTARRGTHSIVTWMTLFARCLGNAALCDLREMPWLVEVFCSARILRELTAKAELVIDE